VIGWQAREEEKRGDANERRSDRAEAPETQRVEKVERGAHCEADREDGGEGVAHPLPSGAEKGDDHACWHKAEREQNGGIGGDEQTGHSRNSNQRLESGRHRPIRDCPAVPDGGHDNGENRVIAHPHQDWRAHRHRHSETAHALQERSEQPGDHQELDGTVIGKAGEE